jgi:hypothetical protein
MAVNFNAANTDKITYGDNLDFNPTDTFSIEFWMKSSQSATQMMLVNKQDGLNKGEGWAVGFQATNDFIRFDFYNTIDIGFTRVGSTDVIDGTWHHICVTYDGGGNATGCKIYVDGVQETETGTGTISGTTATAELLAFGVRAENNSRLYTGDLAEVRIWNDVRTLEEIASYRFRRVAFNEPGLIFYVPLNDGAGNIGNNATSAIDVTGGLTATIGSGGGAPDNSDNPPISMK